MVDATDLIHMMDPSGAPQNINFDEPVSTFDTRYLLDLLLVPAKGNVIVGDGANWDVLGVGADTEVLTADAAQALGVKWAAGGGGGALTVEEQDTVPSVANVTKIKVTNGSLTDDGGGVVSLVTGGGGGGGYTEGARVYNSGNIATGNGVWTILTFDSERYDTDVIHSTLANTERLTCKTAGKYIIIGQAYFAGSTTGSRGMKIDLNGVTVIADIIVNTVVALSGICILVVSTIYDLSVDDYVTLSTFQLSGGALNVVNSPNLSPEFMMGRIG